MKAFTLPLIMIAKCKRFSIVENNTVNRLDRLTLYKLKYMTLYADTNINNKLLHSMYLMSQHSTNRQYAHFLLLSLQSSL